MMNQEFLLINKIAKKLSDLNVTLLIRPYPSIPIEEYQLITLNENVILYEPKKLLMLIDLEMEEKKYSFPVMRKDMTIIIAMTFF